MADLDKAVDKHDPTQSSYGEFRVYEGKFAAHPIDEDELMLEGEEEVPGSGDYAYNQGAYVIIPAFDMRKRWGPCPWHPRVEPHDCGSSPGTACEGPPCAKYIYPTRGDRCLVVFPDTRNPWIIEWWPYGA